MAAVPITFYQLLDGPNTTKPNWQPIGHFSPNEPFADRPKRLRLITWNVWYEQVEQESRFSGFIKEISTITASPVDIIALQEVTPRFLSWLQADITIGSNWLLTDPWDESHRKGIPENWYGIIFLVNRKWARNIRGWAQAFPTSKMGRFVEMVEFFCGDESIVRVANAHLDSPIRETEERKRQSELCGKLLHNNDLERCAMFSSTTLTILCGDLNIFSTAELLDNIPRGFSDSIACTGLDPSVESADSATLGITFALPEEIKKYPPRRSDFVLWKGDNWRCIKHVQFGSTPIKDETNTSKMCVRGINGYLYASDHLAVLTEFVNVAED